MVALLRGPPKGRPVKGRGHPTRLRGRRVVFLGQGKFTGKLEWEDGGIKIGIEVFGSSRLLRPTPGRADKAL